MKLLFAVYLAIGMSVSLIGGINMYHQDKKALSEYPKIVVFIAVAFIILFWPLAVLMYVNEKNNRSF